MFSFYSIKELINALNREKDLLSELFEKRRISLKTEDALYLVDFKDDRLEFLKERGVIRLNGPYIEIGDEFLQFFELILEVNEEINTSSIHEHIKEIKQNILYYLEEKNQSRKDFYLKSVKSDLRRIERITLRNIVDLNRNIEHTFKTEPTYKIKISKLENYDQKRKDINILLEQTSRLLTEDEQTFFKTALDEELKQITLLLRIRINEAQHNLIEIQRQIIEYLNQIKYQSKVTEKLRQIKYLKDQMELKTRTNFMEILAQTRGVIFEPNPAYPLKLSLEYLQTDEAYQAILKMSERIQASAGASVLPLAERIAEDYLQTETEKEIFINTDELKSSFSASGNNLFSFIMNYPFIREVPFQERVTIYCRMVSLYESELNVTETYNKHQEIEYAMVYPG